METASVGMHIFKYQFTVRGSDRRDFFLLDRCCRYAIAFRSFALVGRVLAPTIRGGEKRNSVVRGRLNSSTKVKLDEPGRSGVVI